jgi:hypothetical protein
MGAVLGTALGVDMALSILLERCSEAIGSWARYAGPGTADCTV